MKTMTKVLLAASVLPIALGSASVLAKSGNGDGPRGERGSKHCQLDEPRGMMRELNLTTEQRDQMREFHQAHRNEMQTDRQAHQKQMLELHQQTNQLMLGASFDEQAAHKLAKQMSDLQVERRVDMMKNRYEMMSILTPEQKAKFAELQGERMAGMENCEGRFEHGPKHRMGHGPRGE